MANSDADKSRIAAAPFDKDSANVILRTSDNVDFYVHTAVLSLASGFFETMFSVPQPPASADAPASAQLPKVPVIDVEEDSLTIDFLLRCIYPVVDPFCGLLDLLGRVLAAAKKYEVQVALRQATAQLYSIVPTYPFQVFTIACQHEDEALAQAAVRVCKFQAERQSWPERGDSFEKSLAGLAYREEMGQVISSGSYFRLLKFIRDGEPATFCSSQPSDPREDIDCLTKMHPFNRTDADLVIESSDGLQFPIHRLVVEVNLAPGSEEPLAKRLGVSSEPTYPGGLPVIRMTDDGRTLAMLLALLYPLPASRALAAWDISRVTSSIVVRVIRAAQKYGFTYIEQAYVTRLRQFLQSEPLRVYCVATALGWKDEIATAARQLGFSNPQTMYCPEMETLPACHYNALLRYHHRRQAQPVWTPVGA